MICGVLPFVDDNGKASSTRAPQLAEVQGLWRRSGFTAGTVVHYSQWVRRYTTFCRSHGLEVLDGLTLDGAADFARQYVGTRTRHRNSPANRASARSALRAWSWALRLLGYQVPDWLPVPRARPALPPIVREYAEHRERRRGVAPSTLLRDVEVAQHFLRVVQSRRRRIGTVRVSDLDSFVREVAGRVSARTAAGSCSALRSFLRFLHVNGHVSEDLAACVIAPRVRRLSNPPRGLPWPDVRRLLQAVDRKSPRGNRDYAVLLLMASCGLGTAEVCGLQLDDINWISGVLRVRRPKTGVQIDLPLIPPVAAALARYIHLDRPRHAIDRHVFVTATLPHQRLSGAAVRQLLRKHEGVAGVSSPYMGPHALRHSHATRQVDLGAPPKVLGDILGHLRPASTSIYIRVATKRLRLVGLPVPQ